MVAAASIEKERSKMWFSLEYIHEKRFVEAVKFYCAELEFPDENFEEVLDVERRSTAKSRNINSFYNDFLHWLKRFDKGNLLFIKVIY